MSKVGFKLYFYQDNKLFKKVGVKKGTNLNLTVGTDNNCDIIIHNNRVSRKHLQIIYTENGKLTVTDLNSTNGTFTAPIAGVYQFHLHIGCVNAGDAEFEIQINESAGNGLGGTGRMHGRTVSTDSSLSITVLAKLEVNDNVKVVLQYYTSNFSAQGNDSSHARTFNWFTGHFLG